MKHVMKYRPRARNHELSKMFLIIGYNGNTYHMIILRCDFGTELRGDYRELYPSLHHTWEPVLQRCV